MNYSMNGTEQESARMSNDNVNQPDHYTQGGVECIDAITAATVNKTGIEAVCVANVIKYLWRYELKNGLEDVKKAQWYLNRLVAAMGESGPVLDDSIPPAAVCTRKSDHSYDVESKLCVHCGKHVREVYQI